MKTEYADPILMVVFFHEDYGRITIIRSLYDLTRLTGYKKCVEPHFSDTALNKSDNSL